MAHRGLGPDTPETETVYHNYYIWVPYVLFLQAICFYVPHWLWKMMQTDKVMNVLQVSQGWLRPLSYGRNVPKVSQGLAVSVG